MTTTLILGGARSGKSAYAEKLAIDSGKEVIYIATARAGDGEMAQRIGKHRADRPAHWITVEEPLLLGAAIEQWRAPGRVLLVDCLTLWLTNLIFSSEQAFPDVGVIDLPATFHEQRAALLDALAGAKGGEGDAGDAGDAGDILLVSNEVGMGIVPYGAVSRCFSDEAGRLNQAVAAVCERALFIIAGLPLTLKGAPC